MLLKPHYNLLLIKILVLSVFCSCLQVKKSYSETTARLTKIKYPAARGKHQTDNKYYLALLNLALEQSRPEFGPYMMVESSVGMEQQRAVKEIASKRIDITWTMTSRVREEKLLPIRFPLLQGLGGFRVFMIRDGSQATFDAITNETQLQELNAGQGQHWPDSTILSDNGYKVTTARNHETLFKMLQFNRFDYMPRSVHEIWLELEMLDHVTIEKNFALYYPSPFYFFVHKDNQSLHDRIMFGFEKAHNNGTLAKFFQQDKSTQAILNKARLTERTIFSLTNKLITPETAEVMNNPKYAYYPRLKAAK